ncbi:MAG: hypothetical protein N2749_05295 [Clostridia bacterium]|nr:hypothetical protein [Clostridia bacterium]
MDYYMHIEKIIEIMERNTGNQNLLINDLNSNEGNKIASSLVYLKGYIESLINTQRITSLEATPIITFIIGSISICNQLKVFLEYMLLVEKIAEKGVLDNISSQRENFEIMYEVVKGISNKFSDLYSL